MKAMGTLILLGLSIMGCSTAAEKPVVVQPARYTLSLNALPRVDASKPLQFKASLIPLDPGGIVTRMELTEGEWKSFTRLGMAGSKTLMGRIGVNGDVPTNIITGSFMAVQCVATPGERYEVHVRIYEWERKKGLTWKVDKVLILFGNSKTKL